MVKSSPQFPDKYYQDPTGIDRYVVQEKTLYEWRAPSKINKNRTRQEKLQLVLIVIFLIFVLLLLKELMLAVVVLALTIMYLVMVASQPSTIQCSVTTLGIKIEEKYFFWPDISQYWLEEKAGQQVLHFRVIFPRVTIWKIILHDQDVEKLPQTLGTYLLYKKPTRTQLQKFLHNLQEKLPIDLDFLQV